MTHKSSAQLERETEETRERVSSLLDELRDRASPGEVFDQLYDYARNGGGAQFVQTLGQQVKSNPLALALIGAGLGWLMFSDRRARTDGRAVDYDHQSELDFFGTDRHLTEPFVEKDEYEETGEYDRTPDFSTEEDAGDDADRTARYTRARLKGAKSWARDTGRSVSETASDYANRARDAASRGAESISEGYDAARERASEWAGASRRQASRALDAGRRMFVQAQEQPLVLAGIGFAVGAALGASLPRTQTEDQFMGETSDNMKESARSFGREQVEKAQTAAVDIAERGLDEAERGLAKAEHMADEAALVPPDYNTEQNAMAETAEGAFGTSRDDGGNR
jgi:hypothetical protein